MDENTLERYQEAEHRVIQSITVDRRLRAVVLALTLAWLGILFHDLREFGQPLIESSIAMGVITVLLFFLWHRRPELRCGIALLMLAYAIINLIGALTSILPLGVWLFDPEQSFEHYLSHAIWAIAELPLMWEMISYVRTNHQEG